MQVLFQVTLATEYSNEFKPCEYGFDVVEAHSCVELI